MEVVNLSQVNQTNFTNKQEVPKETQKVPEQKKNGTKLLALGAAAITTIAIAGLIIKNKHNKLQEVIKDGAENPSKLHSNIQETITDVTTKPQTNNKNNTVENTLRKSKSELLECATPEEELDSLAPKTDDKSIREIVMDFDDDMEYEEERITSYFDDDDGFDSEEPEDFFKDILGFSI